MVRTALLWILVLGVLLAGCTEPPPEPVDEGPRLPSLEQFKDCPWEYPDNSSHDCEPGSIRLEAEPDPPIGWICTAEDRHQGWSLHWNPVADELGLWIELPGNASEQPGILYLRTGGGEHLFEWEDPFAAGFLRFPVEFGDNATFRYATHGFGYAMNGTLTGAQATPVWSLFQSQFWVIHQFETDNATYTFQNMTTREFRVDRADGGEGRLVSYEVDPFQVYGDDFALWVHHERGHFATSQGSVGTILMDRFCQTGLG